jgi:hypothetical protein
MKYVTLLISRSDACASIAPLPDIYPGTQNSLPHRHQKYVPWAILMLMRIIAGDRRHATYQLRASN